MGISYTVGTPKYMAPEVKSASSEHSFDPQKADGKN